MIIRIYTFVASVGINEQSAESRIHCIYFHNSMHTLGKSSLTILMRASLGSYPTHWL